MKKLFLVVITSLLSCYSINALAVNLLDVYAEAQANDPQFKAANAKWLADREVLPISKASLLPQISAQGSIARTRTDFEGGQIVSPTPIFEQENGGFYSNLAAYSVSLTQPVFNFGSWANVWGAQAKVKQAGATFASAIESLAFRSAQAYFAVLQAGDVLRFTQANKEAVWRQLEQTKHRYEVGLIAITDLENTRASYDSAIADEITAKKNLTDNFEKLTQLTGIKYTEISALKENIPLINPNPNNSERWVKGAEKQNYDLIAARFAALAARENIKTQFSGHLPTLSAVGSYNYNYNNDNTGQQDFSRSKVASAGLSLNVPIFQGGAVTEQTKQACYLYQQALAQQEQTHRSVVSQTNQAFLGVIAGISRVKADKQLVKSTESALRSTEAGYTVGTRTMVDVLKAESDYYNSQKSLAIDEYDYITQTLLLKQLAGVLAVDDLQKINSWLQPLTVTQKPNEISSSNKIVKKDLHKKKKITKHKK
ncbi:MAG: TolC family outer membrane protein [Gammaproteobacteria bacterium]|nr:TolC family outer membrane protein [Gammaproteobacteria bacterium]